MSEHRFVCPCGQHLSCDDSLLGKEIACPTCGTMLQLGEKPATPLLNTGFTESLQHASEQRQYLQKQSEDEKTESVRILRHQAEFKLEKARQTGDMSAVERQKAILAALKNGSPPPEDNTESEPTIRVVRRQESNGYDHTMIYRPRKSIVAFILLGFFFGALGIHNFYAGYQSDGMKQLLISLLSPLVLYLLFGFIGFFIHLLVVLAIFIWVIIDLISKNCDANGVEMV